VDTISSTVIKSQFLTFTSAVLVFDLLSLSNMKVQDFRAALRDDEVKSLFIEMFNEKIEQCVKTSSATLFADIMDKFTKKFDELNINLISLRAEVQRKDVVIGQLTTRC
jgi:glycine cleavage system regulatory protein